MGGADKRVTRGDEAERQLRGKQCDGRAQPDPAWPVFAQQRSTTVADSRQLAPAPSQSPAERSRGGWSAHPCGAQGKGGCREPRMPPSWPMQQETVQVFRRERGALRAAIKKTDSKLEAKVTAGAGCASEFCVTRSDRPWGFRSAKTKVMIVIQGLPGKPVADSCHELHSNQGPYDQWRARVLVAIDKAFEGHQQRNRRSFRQGTVPSDNPSWGHSRESSKKAT